jgi:hypothetical protein
MSIFTDMFSCSDKQGRQGKQGKQGRQNSSPAPISPPAQEQLASTKKFLNRAVLGWVVGIKQHPQFPLYVLVCIQMFHCHAIALTIDAMSFLMPTHHHVVSHTIDTL